ncbi:flagellar hook-basal body complex protein FliE [Planktomarina temperata]|nr:flagellar hook-basal body complex protein FliE [Planktomarina temperata]
MTQISGLKFQVEQTHLQNLKKAEQALGTEVTGPSFSERITTGLKDVAGAQNDASKLAQDYELGLEQDLSKVMVSQQVSSLGFQLTLNLRNKALSAYKDIMNMPV